jgi:hypothetical protein
MGCMQTGGFRNLILQAQAGDPEAIERLFREVSPFVEALVRARGVRAGDSVRDEAQDTSVRILSKLGQFRGADEAPDDERAGKLFCSWVRVIAKHVILKETYGQVGGGVRRPAPSAEAGYCPDQPFLQNTPDPFFLLISRSFSSIFL